MRVKSENVPQQTTATAYTSFNSHGVGVKGKIVAFKKIKLSSISLFGKFWLSTTLNGSPANINQDDKAHMLLSNKNIYNISIAHSGTHFGEACSGLGNSRRFLKKVGKNLEVKSHQNVNLSGLLRYLHLLSYFIGRIDNIDKTSNADEAWIFTDYFFFYCFIIFDCCNYRLLLIRQIRLIALLATSSAHRQVPTKDF